MNTGLFSEFLASGDTLRLYSGDKLIFTSSEDGLRSLLGTLVGSTLVRRMSPRLTELRAMPPLYS